MKLITIVTAVFIFVIVDFQSFGQDKSEIISQRIEFISEQIEVEDADFTDIVQQLIYYYDHPLNLNKATKEDLESLILLNDIQINALMLHRYAFGKILSIYELQSVAYWDISTIRRILPFVIVDEKLDQLHVSLGEMIDNGKFETYLRFQKSLQLKNGYANVSDSLKLLGNSFYHGNDNKYYTRLRYSYANNLSIGVTAEKDPGEEFFKGSQTKGFDFYSSHFYYRGGKYLRSVALGDFQIQIGQGILLWTGYAFGKSADVTNIRKSAMCIKPYTSSDESRFLRGGAVDLNWKNISLLTFASKKRVDASIVSDSSSPEMTYVASINTSGLHRTNSEISRRKALLETISGISIRYDKRSMHIGLSTIYQSYEFELLKVSLPYNQFEFSGKSTLGFSSDYSWNYKNMIVFGEVASANHSQTWAQLHGCLIHLDQRLAISLLYRDYQRDFHTFYNNAFSEGSTTRNEKGMYAGLKTAISNSITMNAYVDVFSFPWFKYLVDAPSKGQELFFQTNYKPNRNLDIYCRIREQIRQLNSRDSDGTLTSIEDVKQRNFRVNISCKVSESIRLNSRLELVKVNRASNNPEQGILFYQDFIFRPKSFPLDLSLRYALFDTDSYDSRIYSYENNALYVFSVPSYYYTGSRAYILLRYSVLKKCDLWVKYGLNIYDNRTVLGSGLEEIKGNRKSEITIQLRLTL